MNKKILRILFIMLTLTTNAIPAAGQATLLLQDAIKRGDVAALRRFKINGADLNTRNHRGWTLLHETVRYGYSTDIITELLSLGIDEKAKTPAGNTALHLAAMEGRKDHLSMLLQHQADVSTKNKRGQTPLHLAAEHGFLECINLLLLYESDHTATDAQGLTPLDWARKNEHADCATALKQHKAHCHSMQSEP